MRSENLISEKEPVLRAGSLLALVAAVLLAALPAALQAQSVSFAGAQTTLGSGFFLPAGLAVDTSGNVFVADVSRVVEVSPGGVQTTVVSGLNGAEGVAVDATGNLFIAESVNGVVVEVSPSGAQTPVASGLSGPQGVAVDAAGNVFIADKASHRVLKVPAGGGDPTILASGSSGPHYLAVDSAGDLFASHLNGNSVTEISPSGAQATVPAIGLNDPDGVAVDTAGNVFVADNFNNRVVEVSPGAVQTTVPASGLHSPAGVAVDAAGDIFIADTANYRVVEVQPVAVNFGSVNIGSSSQTATLTYNVTASGTLGTAKVLTEGAPNLDFSLSSSTCTGNVTEGSTCTVNVTFTPRFAGLRRGAVQITDASGNVLATTFIYGTGLGPQIAFGPGVQTTVPAAGLAAPYGVAVDGAGDLFIADAPGGQVVEVPAGGGAQTTVGTGLFSPKAVAVDAAGDVFITDTFNNRVVEVSPSGAQTTVPASGLASPTGVAVDGAGDVYIADNNNNRVVKVPAGGGAQITIGSGLNSPGGVAVDAAGDVFIADLNNNRVVEVSPSGIQTTVGSGLNLPIGVAVDAAGDVFIADNNNRVVEVPAGGGAQTTVASGLNGPFGLALDAAGDLFIADSQNGRVVELQHSAPPSLSFADTQVGYTSSDSPQSVAVENIGNAALSISGLTVGTNFTQEQGSGTPADCTNSSSLAPGASCSLSIGFTPTTSGKLTGSVTLTDNSLNGNPATQTIALSGTGTPRYTFSGFLAPVNSAPAINTGKAGKTYPIKWQLTDSSGNLVSALSVVESITSQSVACGSFSGGTATIAATATGGTGLRYDTTANQYVYNWATPPTAGCYVLQLKLTSGQSFTADFQLK